MGPDLVMAESEVVDPGLGVPEYVLWGSRSWIHNIIPSTSSQNLKIWTETKEDNACEPVEYVEDL